MKLYYKQGWGITMLTLGGTLLLINLILIGMGAGVKPQIIISLMLPVMGIFYLTKPCFEITEKQLIIFNLFGMAVKTYRYSSLSDVSIRENKIYINDQGADVKTKVNRMMIRNNDWDAMVEYVAANSSQQSMMDAAKELHVLPGEK